MAKRYFKEPLPFTLIGMTEQELYNEINLEVDAMEEYADIPSDSGYENDSDGVNDCEITNAEAEFNFDGDNIMLSDKEDETLLPMDTWDPENLLPLSQLKAMGKIQWCNGVAQDIKDLSNPSPYTLFCQFISDEVLNNIVFQTNLYAEQNYQKTGKPYKLTDIPEMKTFLGINLLMGMKKLPSYRDHWSQNPDLRDPYISKLMTVHRFGWMLSNIHLNDNTRMPERNTNQFDKLYKIRPFIKIIRDNFRRCIYSHEHIAIDESMIEFEGRSSLK
nr:piggyBac transposable element-derived protein 4-like [Leptinotarsa decemlineata]